MNSRKSFDVLIIGSGIAGLCAAINGAKQGYEVALISKEPSLLETNTRYAQGGIIGVVDNDSPELLEGDILLAGDETNYLEAVRLLVQEGPKLVPAFLMEEVGVPFSRAEDGKIDLTREAAHSIRRIYHVEDKTGEAIQTGLVRYIERLPQIKSFHSHTAIELITNTHNSLDPQFRYRKTRVIGAYILNEITGKVSIFFAGKVILATGGVGNLFLHTSNPAGATGDGIAMAYRIGTEIINAEFIQFHPTVLYHRDVKRFLISESLRGEGARLMNKKGEYFMVKYDQERKDLAPRDEAVRAIYREMEDEDSEYVRLDACHVKEVDLEKRFPGIFSRCFELGIDIRREPIPVVPGAHYFCGGIKVNLEGETSIPGLCAVGECACTGVHGANRLASVSLLEGMLWGLRCGHVPMKKKEGLTERQKKMIPDWIYPKTEEFFDPVLVHQDLRMIRSTMWNYAGVIRSHKRLLRALADLNYHSHRIEQFYRAAKLTKGIIELRNSVLAAGIIVHSALANPKSVGCHYIE